MPYAPSNRSARRRANVNQLSDASSITSRTSDLRDNTRRWLRDRDRDLGVQTNSAINRLALQGHLYSGAFLTGLADVKRQALQEHRDEISRKRTIYRGLLDGETWAHRRLRGKPLERYELTDDDRAILAAWRAPATYEGHPDEGAPVDDPTSEEREPDLRRFEREAIRHADTHRPRSRRRLAVT